MDPGFGWVDCGVWDWVWNEMQGWENGLGLGKDGLGFGLWYCEGI